jgi:hypothetical protein
MEKQKQRTYEAPRLTTYGDVTALTKRPATRKSN